MAGAALGPAAAGRRRGVRRLCGRPRGGRVCLLPPRSSVRAGLAELSASARSQGVRPPTVPKASCADGSLCAEYFHQRRTLVPVDSLPVHVRKAFLAAEDADFYRHEGLDYLGMVRAAARTLLFGSRPTGASTITQQ